MKRLLSKIFIVLTLLAIYIAYTGRVNTLTISTGLLVSIAVVIVLEKIKMTRIPGMKIYRFLQYVYYFMIVEIKEHIEVAKIILKPGIVIRPGFIEIPLKVESEVSIAILALSITNTPGTIAVDVNKSKKTMIVHWIDIKSENRIEAANMILGKLEDIAKEVFG